MTKVSHTNTQHLLSKYKNYSYSNSWHICEKLPNIKALICCMKIPQRQSALLERVGMGKIPDGYLQSRLSLKGLRKTGTALTQAIRTHTDAHQLHSNDVTQLALCPHC